MQPTRTKQQSIASTQAELLKRLRSLRGVARVELARQLNLAPSTVGGYVDRLIADGYLLEGPKADRDVGRPPTILELNPHGGRFVGVDIEARNVMAVAVDFCQRPLKQCRLAIDPLDTVDEVLTKVERAVRRVLAGDDLRLLGIGVGVPGAVDPERGASLHYEYIHGWNDVPLGPRLGDRFRVPIHLENNIRSMALAELWLGQGLGIDHFVCLGIRSGIAAGVVIGGQLYHGHSHLAGEIGGWPCPRDLAERAGDLPASDGTQVVRLEDVASVRALLSRWAQAELPMADREAPSADAAAALHDVAQAAGRDDRRTLVEIARVARCLGWAVCQINLLLNPQRVIVAGPLAALGDRLIEPLTATVRRLTPPRLAAVPEITASALGEFVGALGAAALAFHHFKPMC